ncbi:MULTISPECIES: hypothetical protein [Pseudomonadati]|uniref:Uncharacterized protein n=1 Tax=Shewanella aestuarii TaxID=1028752 RepID=A0ABT0L480_9GAMM|nr:hypothetical protein [Shewanella aestuarii]MCL1118539.1 hypothetical protein [Shewanella aestuarii]GGN83012.1 hypothetical protein GCM10009193_30770 [Shewanella aestuarii]
MKYIFLVILSFFISLQAEAKNCKKGQPCGNSCISWNKICRVDSSMTSVSIPSGNTKDSQSVILTLDKSDPRSENYIQYPTTADIAFGCDTSWLIIIDKYVLNFNEGEVISRGIGRIKSRLNEQGLEMSSVYEARLKSEFHNSISTPNLTSSMIHEIKTNPDSVKKLFVPQCILETQNQLSKG